MITYTSVKADEFAQTDANPFVPRTSLICSNNFSEPVWANSIFFCRNEQTV